MQIDNPGYLDQFRTAQKIFGKVCVNPFDIRCPMGLASLLSFSTSSFVKIATQTLACLQTAARGLSSYDCRKISVSLVFTT